MQKAFETATDQLKTQQKAVTGQINITAPMSVGSVFISPLLAKFMSLYPDIQIELDLSDKAVNLSESHYNLAIRAASQLPDSSLHAKKLHDYDYVIAGSPQYFENYGYPSQPSELSKHRAITCITSHQSLQGKWPFDGPQGKVFVDLAVVSRITHMWVQKQFALEGLGLIRVPRYWVKDELSTGKLQATLTDHMSDTSSLFAIYKQANPTPLKIKTLIDYLTQHLPPFLS